MKVACNGNQKEGVIAESSAKVYFRVVYLVLSIIKALISSYTDKMLITPLLVRDG